MNYIDIILLILLLLAAIGGFKNGFITELASLAGLILGIWGAFEFSDLTSDVLVKNFNVHWEHLKLFSLIITFIVIAILVHIVAGVVNKMVEAAMLGILNRLAGLVFGIIKSVLVLSVVLVVFDRINSDVTIIHEDKINESRLYKPIRNLAPSIFPFIEDWVNEFGTGGDTGKS
jgi:membrane protein required for colicin V production